MKCHVLFESSDHTNGRIVGVWKNEHKAMQAFSARMREEASRMGDEAPEISKSYGSGETWECLTYMPEGDQEAGSVSLMLFLDVEVTE